MNNENQITQKSSKKGLIIGIVFLAIVIAGIGGFIYYNNNYPKVKSLSLSLSERKLYVDEEFRYEVDYSPADAKNKEVIWTTSDSSVVSISRGTVVGKSTGTANICAELRTDRSIKACSKIEVISKKNKFKNHLISVYGCRETGAEKVFCTGSGIDMEFDFNNRKYTQSYESIEYIYYYDRGYVEGSMGIDGYLVEYFYSLHNGSFSCLGSDPYFHAIACSYSNQTIAQNNIEGMIEIFNNYLGSEYTIEDLY